MLSRPLFFISLWFRHRIEELLGLNFGLGVVSMIETWCSCCIGVVPTSFYPISSYFDTDTDTNFDTFFEVSVPNIAQSRSMAELAIRLTHTSQRLVSMT